MTKEEQIKILSRAFPAKLIKTKPGSHGRKLRYVEGAEYIRRLNEAFGNNWDFRITEHFGLDDSIVVKGELSVYAFDESGETTTMITKEAFGGTEIKRRRKDDKMIALADDYKSAATDALKKASSLLGVGLHLYSDDHPPVQQPAPPAPPIDVLSKTQLDEIISIAKDKEWNKQKLLMLTQDLYGKLYNKLSPQEAAELISSMKGTL